MPELSSRRLLCIRLQHELPTWPEKDRVDRAKFPGRIHLPYYCNNTARRTILDGWDLSPVPVNLSRRAKRRTPVTNKRRSAVTQDYDAEPTKFTSMDDVFTSDRKLPEARRSTDEDICISRSLPLLENDSAVGTGTSDNVQQDKNTSATSILDFRDSSPFASTSGLNGSTPKFPDTNNTEASKPAPFERLHVRRENAFTSLDMAKRKSMCNVLDFRKTLYMHQYRENKLSQGQLQEAHRENAPNSTLSSECLEETVSDPSTSSSCIGTPSMRQVDLELSELHIATPDEPRSNTSLTPSGSENPSSNGGVGSPSTSNEDEEQSFIERKKRKRLSDVLTPHSAPVLLSNAKDPSLDAPDPSISVKSPLSVDTRRPKNLSELANMLGVENYRPTKRIKLEQPSSPSHSVTRPSSAAGKSAPLVKTTILPGPVAGSEIIQIDSSSDEGS